MGNTIQKLRWLKTNKVFREAVRKIFHLMSGGVVFILVFFDRATALFWISWAIIVFLIIDITRIKGRYIYPFKIIEDVVARPAEINSISGGVYFAIGGFAAVFFFAPIVAITAVTVSAFGDAAAAIVGVSFGKHKLPMAPDKSVEGAIAGFIMSSLVGTICMDLICDIIHALTYAIFAGLAFALTDSIELPISDNLVNPIFIGLVLTVVIFLLG